MNSRIQAGWSGLARAETIIPSTTASESKGGRGQLGMYDVSKRPQFREYHRKGPRRGFIHDESAGSV